MRLRTERLDLRELVESDAEALAAVEGGPEVARYQSFEPRSFGDSLAYVRAAAVAAGMEPRALYDLGIVRRDDGELIGRVGLGVQRENGPQGTLWYTLRPDCWGRGLATEAARALVRCGFQELGLHRVWAECDPRNERSWRLLERLGMRREAHHVESTYLKGEWVDSYVYAILDREWGRKPLI